MFFISPRQLERLRNPRPEPRLGPVPDGARPLLDTASADPQNPATLAMQRAWLAHVDAGRIGVPAPAPVGPGDYGCASLAAILAGAGRRA